MFHLEHWNKQVKQIGIYLNKNSSKEEFEKLSHNLQRLEKVVDEQAREIFNSKDSFLFLTLFDRFTRLEIADVRFVEFLKEFQSKLRDKEINGVVFDQIDKDKGTKDKAVIRSKLDMLEALMLEFLQPDHQESESRLAEAFISENVEIDIENLRSDMDFYKESLMDLENRTIRHGSRLLCSENQLSLLAMVVYSYKEDQDLDEWMAEYAIKNNDYDKDQKKNFLFMREDFQRFVGRKDRKSAIGHL